MKFKYLGFPLIVTLIVALSAVSCSDVWDEHYNSEPLNKSNLNLYQYISADTTLTKFTRMLQITHYDSLLSQSQSYTVWAPTNASLAGVDLKDSVAVSNIVGNHVTRFSYSTSILESMNKILRMFDKKLLPFEKTATGYTFAGKLIIKPDLATKNGIVHILGEYAPYTYNFWEYINKTPGLDSLRTYLNSMTMKTYDPAASFQDGVFVDSVFKSANIILDKVAALNTEDSIYTAILPTNAAWNDAYARIAPYYKFLASDGGAQTQMAYTKLSLIQDLFFRTKLSLPFSGVSLKSTIGHNFSNPANLFGLSTTSELSNGRACVSNQLDLRPTESWFDTLRVEAEAASFKTLQKFNYDQYIYSGIGSNLSISGGRYLYLKDLSVNGLNPPYATFDIPNTLSAKYNIYCVFVPGSLVTAGDNRPNKVSFYLTYIDATGKQLLNTAIDANNLLTTKTSTVQNKFPAGAGVFTSKPAVVDKMLVAKNVVFPFCNILTTTTSKSTISLAVVNAAGFTTSEKATFNRNLIIDCIILEPVLQ
jgi:Secreted and surface protein containing fasciclin-like repeats